MRIAKGEGHAAAAHHILLPPGQWRLGGMNLIGREAVEIIIASVERADMIKAQILPTADIAMLSDTSTRLGTTFDDASVAKKLPDTPYTLTPEPLNEIVIGLDAPAARRPPTTLRPPDEAADQFTAPAVPVSGLAYEPL